MTIPGVDVQTPAVVRSVAAVGPRMMRFVFALEEPDALVFPGRGDDAVGIYFPDSSGIPASGRNYTIRSVNESGDLVIDVVLHDHGVAADWARRARSGDTVAMAHARAWYRPPTDADWQLLVADMAGLPALARIVEESDEVGAINVIVEVDEAGTLDYLPHRDEVRVIASVGTGNGFTPSKLAERVAEFEHPAGRGYCWFAGEAAQSRAVRKHLRNEYGFVTEQFDITGYWRMDSEKWDKRFAEVADDMMAVYTQALEAGKGDKVAGEELDEALERVGL